MKDAGATTGTDAQSADATKPNYPVAVAQHTSGTNVNIPSSSSVSSASLSEKRNSSAFLTQSTRTATQNSPLHATASSSTGISSKSSVQKRDKDEELFEFLNSPDNGADNAIAKKASQTNLKAMSSGKHSRQSSVSSTVSNKSSSKVADLKSSVALSLNTVDISSGMLLEIYVILPVAYV